MAGLLDWFNHTMKKVDPLDGLISSTVADALGYKDSLQMVRGIGEPVGNAFGMYYTGLPIGSLVFGADAVSQGKDPSGHLMNAGLTYAGGKALSGLGSTGSTAASGTDVGLAATEATQGLSSTGGTQAGQVVADSGFTTAAAPTGSATFDASNFGAQNTFGQTGEFGYQGLNAPSYSTSATQQFMATPTSQFSSAAGVGGYGQGLEGTASQVAQGAKSGGMNYGALAEKVGTFAMQQQAKSEEEARRKNELMKMQSQAAANASAAAAPQPSAQVQPFQNMSPYAKFSGGFRPVSYGANVRKQNYGLLG